MEKRHLFAEIGGEAGHHLGGQGNFRDEDHHRLTPLQEGLGKADINEGLAAARHAVEEGHTRFARFRALQHIFKNTLLHIVQGNGRGGLRIVTLGNAVLLLLT